jgi:hypothetical protein
MADTVAVLLIIPGMVVATTIEIVAEFPSVTVPRLQLTGPVPLQLPWLGVLETHVTLPGKVSATMTPVAVLGPVFVTVIVYVRFSPTTSTGSGESALRIDRSADALTVVLSLSLLLPGTGSFTLEDTLAVLVIVPPSLGAVAVMVISGAGPTAKLARVQVIPRQLHPVPLAVAPVTPAGSVSVTLTLVAVLGPLFVTVRVYVRFWPTTTGSGASVLVMDKFA